MKKIDYLEYSSSEPMIKFYENYDMNNIYKDCPEKINKEEAIEDLKYIKYVLENGYSGFTYYDHSLFNNAYKNIEEELKNIDFIAINDFIDLICSKLDFISDGHLNLLTRNYGKNFYKKLQTYVSDLVIEKIEDKYYDIESKRLLSFDDDVQLFKSIDNLGKECYLIGKRSTVKVDNIKVKIDNEIKTLDLHEIRSNEYSNDPSIKEEYLDKVAIITSPNFEGNSDEFEKMYDIGKKCRNYEHVIWDLSYNGGGDSRFAEYFLRGLYGEIDNSLTNCLELNSSLVHAKITGEMKNIEYELVDTSEAPIQIKDLYKGNLHIIINDYIASSAEMALRLASAYKNVTYYGCNTLGIGKFGDLCFYYLPYSKILLACPYKVFDIGIEEGIGFTPNYWIDNKNVTSFVLNVINKK